MNYWSKASKLSTNQTCLPVTGPTSSSQRTQPATTRTEMRDNTRFRRFVYLSTHCYGSVKDSVHAQNGWLRGVDDRGAHERPEHSSIADRERSTVHIFHCQLSILRLKYTKSKRRWEQTTSLPSILFLSRLQISFTRQIFISLLTSCVDNRSNVNSQKCSATLVQRWHPSGDTLMRKQQTRNVIARPSARKNTSHVFWPLLKHRVLHTALSVISYFLFDSIFIWQR